MKVHPQVVHLNGIVSVTIIASFIGDTTDLSDQTRIQAYGDPSINLVGMMTDPADATFQFTFGAPELYVGITTQMQNYTARFMTSLPMEPPPYGAYPSSIGAGGAGNLCPTPGPGAGGNSGGSWGNSGGSWGRSGVNPFFPTPGYPQGYHTMVSTQGLLDCAVTDPVRAATIWASTIDSRVTAAMITLRALIPPQLVSLPDATA